MIVKNRDQALLELGWEVAGAGVGSLKEGYEEFFDGIPPTKGLPFVECDRLRVHYRCP